MEYGTLAQERCAYFETYGGRTGTKKSVTGTVEGATVRNAQRGRQAAMGGSRWAEEPGERGHASRNGRYGGERFDDGAGSRSTGGSVRGARGSSWDESYSRGGSDRNGR